MKNNNKNVTILSYIPYYDCDNCNYVEKCKRKYVNLKCFYNSIKIYSKEDCKKLFNKLNEIISNIDEFKLIDHENFFENSLEDLLWELEHEMKDLLSDKAIKEWEELINE